MNDTWKKTTHTEQWIEVPPHSLFLCSGNVHQFCLTQPDLHQITVDTVSIHTVSDFLQLRFWYSLQYFPKPCLFPY